MAKILEEMFTGTDVCAAVGVFERHSSLTVLLLAAVSKLLENFL